MPDKTGVTWERGRKDVIVPFVRSLATDKEFYDDVKENAQARLKDLVGIEVPDELIPPPDDWPKQGQIRQLLRVLEPRPGIEPLPFGWCFIIGVAMAAGAEE